MQPREIRTRVQIDANSVKKLHDRLEPALDTLAQNYIELQSVLIEEFESVEGVNKEQRENFIAEIKKLPVNKIIAESLACLGEVAATPLSDYLYNKKGKTNKKISNSLNKLDDRLIQKLDNLAKNYTQLQSALIEEFESIEEANEWKKEHLISEIANLPANKIIAESLACLEEATATPLSDYIFKKKWKTDKKISEASLWYEFTRNFSTFLWGNSGTTAVVFLQKKIGLGAEHNINNKDQKQKLKAFFQEIELWNEENLCRLFLEYLANLPVEADYMNEKTHIAENVIPSLVNKDINEALNHYNDVINLTSNVSQHRNDNSYKKAIIDSDLRGFVIIKRPSDHMLDPEQLCTRFLELSSKLMIVRREAEILENIKSKIEMQEVKQIYEEAKHPIKSPLPNESDYFSEIEMQEVKQIYEEAKYPIKLPLPNEPDYFKEYVQQLKNASQFVKDQQIDTQPKEDNNYRYKVLVGGVAVVVAIIGAILTGLFAPLVVGITVAAIVALGVIIGAGITIMIWHESRQSSTAMQVSQVSLSQIIVNRALSKNEKAASANDALVLAKLGYTDSGYQNNRNESVAENNTVLIKVAASNNKTDKLLTPRSALNLFPPKGNSLEAHQPTTENVTQTPSVAGNV